MGVVSQKDKTMKLTAMVDARVTCVPKNFKVDGVTKQRMLNDKNRQSVLEFEAPTLDQQLPIYLPLK